MDPTVCPTTTKPQARILLGADLSVRPDSYYYYYYTTTTSTTAVRSSNDRIAIVPFRFSHQKNETLSSSIS